MAASYQSATDAYNRYMAMVQSGMSPMDAVQQSGLVDLRQQQLKAEGRAQQRGALGQVGGAVIGKLGIQAGKDFLAGEKILGGLRGDIANAGTKLSEALGLGGGSNVAQTAAQNAAWNAQAGAAQNAAWNAGADAATSAVSGTTPPPTQAGIFAPGSGLMTALGGAGAALGAYGAFKGIENKDPLSAGLGGAGVAGGLSAMGLALGPLGWAGLIAAPALGALINKMGDKDRWKEEYDRKKKLVEQGIIPESMLGEAPSKGRSQEELVALEEQKVAAGQYGNPDFARTRDVALLKPQDIWGFSVAPETIGKDYMAASEEQRLAFNQKLLDEGLVSEARGQISYKDPKRAKEIWNEVTGKTV